MATMYISGISLLVGLYGDIVALIQKWEGCIDLSSSEGCESKIISVMPISSSMNVTGLTPSLDLCTSLCHCAKKQEGLIWGFTITVMCYKNEFLQTPLLSPELLTEKVL